MSVRVKKRFKRAEVEPSCLPDGGRNVDDMPRINEKIVPIGRDLSEKVFTKPKPPASAYVMWIREEGMQLVKSKFPHYKPAALGREAEKLWLTLDPTVKGTYVDRNKDETEQWMVNCRKWRIDRGHDKAHSDMEEPSLDKNEVSMDHEKISCMMKL